MMQESEIKQWTAKRIAELIRQICKGQTTIEEASREYDLTPPRREKSNSDSEGHA